MSKAKAPKTVTIETPVGVRTLPQGKEWWEGTGRGHVREFIPTDGEMECRSCHESLPLTSFPTFSVPRKDGRTRSDECRGCRGERRIAAAKKAKRQEAARKAAAKRKGRVAVATA